MELPELIPLLAKHRVKRFKSGELEIEFDSAEIQATAIQSQPLPAHMPPELRDPDAMSSDQVLNWSSGGSGPAQQEPPLPMTGDAPIDPSAA